MASLLPDCAHPGPAGPSPSTSDALHWPHRAVKVHRTVHRTEQGYFVSNLVNSLSYLDDSINYRILIVEILVLSQLNKPDKMPLILFHLPLSSS